MTDSTANDTGAIYQSAWARISSDDDCQSAARATTSSRFIHSAVNLATKVRKFAFFMLATDGRPGKRRSVRRGCERKFRGEVLGEVECKVSKSHFLFHFHSTFLSPFALHYGTNSSFRFLGSKFLHKAQTSERLMEANTENDFCNFVWLKLFLFFHCSSSLHQNTYVTARGQRMIQHLSSPDTQEPSMASALALSHQRLTPLLLN